MNILKYKQFQLFDRSIAFNLGLFLIFLEQSKTPSLKQLRIYAEDKPTSIL